MCVITVCHWTEAGVGVAADTTGLTAGLDWSQQSSWSQQQQLEITPMLTHTKQCTSHANILLMGKS